MNTHILLFSNPTPQYVSMEKLLKNDQNYIPQQGHLDEYRAPEISRSISTAHGVRCPWLSEANLDLLRIQLSRVLIV